MIPPPFTDFDSILTGGKALLAEYRANNDEKGIFLTAYLAMTATLKHAVETNGQTGIFHDPEWITKYAVAFANLYREALIQEETQTEPKSWKIAFDAARNNSALVFQDLLLGINAHINRDLPFALKEVGVFPQAQRRADHLAINRVLQTALEPVQTSIAEGYAAGLGVLFNLFDPFDDDISNFAFTTARDVAWVHGVALATAGEENLPMVARSVEQNASVLAKLILRPNLEFSFLLPALRYAETQKKWQAFL
jgi:hypothetical protein